MEQYTFFNRNMCVICGVCGLVPSMTHSTIGFFEFSCHRCTFLASYSRLSGLREEKRVVCQYTGAAPQRAVGVRARGRDLLYVMIMRDSGRDLQRVAFASAGPSPGRLMIMRRARASGGGCCLGVFNGRRRMGRSSLGQNFLGRVLKTDIPILYFCGRAAASLLPSGLDGVRHEIVCMHLLELGVAARKAGLCR